MNLLSSKFINDKDEDMRYEMKFYLGYILFGHRFMKDYIYEVGGLK